MGAVLNGHGRMPRFNTQPAFDAEQVALQRRMRFNPLRMLTPENLSMALDQFDIGILRMAALLWDAMIRRDDTLSFVVPQLENSIAGKPWGVFKKKGADPAEAARHAAALEYFYGNVTAVNAFDRNERGDRHLLLKQASSSFAFRYALHHFVWKPVPGKMIEAGMEGAQPVPALTAEMEYVPLWYFENTTGTLRFLPFGGFGAVGQEMDFDGEWMCTTGPGMMFGASICYTFKRLAFQDWTVFNERYAQQKVIGQTAASRDSDQGQAMAQMVADFNSDMGIVLYNSQPGDKPPISLLGPAGTVSVDLFERFLDRQDRKTTVMFRGSDLRNMSREKDVTGVSAQTQETDALELAHCANIASAFRAGIDRNVIRYCFGEGVEPLAYFGLPEMDETDAQQLRDSAGFLADRGAMVDRNTVAERLGIALTEDPDAALEGIGQVQDQEGDDFDDEPLSTGNARGAARLEQLIEEALRTRNGGNSEGSRKGWDTRRRNAQHGLESIRKAIATKADVIDAMHVEELGSVDFRWAVGERGMQQIVNVHRIAHRIPIILARGKIVAKGSTRAVVEYRGHRVILSNNISGTPTSHWVLTGYRDKKKGNR